MVNDNRNKCNNTKILERRTGMEIFLTRRDALSSTVHHDTDITQMLF